MALTVTGNVKITTSLSEPLTTGLSTGTVSASESYAQTWENGSGAESINEAFTKSAMLAISTPVTFTLSALTDDLGRSIVFTKVREFYLRNNGTADLTIGGAAAAPWVALFGDVSDKLKIKPGGVLHLVAPDVNGYAVAAGTSDQLKLDPGATACPYKLVLKGA